ncbi:MAG: Uma2 family endonuclease [Planctomycetota bacterium]
MIPVHDDIVEYLEEWSHSSRTADQFRIRVQCGIVVEDNRPEPDIAWLRPTRRRAQRPTAADICLLIEVADRSLIDDLRTKADLYAACGVVEVWIVHVPNRRIHVMAKPVDGLYQDIRIVTHGQELSPICHASARLDTADLFSFEP